MDKIVIDLSPQSIDNAIAWAKQEKQKIQDTINSLLETCVNEGADIARANVKNFETGETYKSIEGIFVEDNKAIIVASGNAIWLEFGTGVLRNREAYPLNVKGISPVGTYKKGLGSRLDGWLFPTDNPKYAQQDEDGNYITFTSGSWAGKMVGHTKGIKANRFLYEALLHIQSNAPSWAKDMFSNM